MILPIGAARSAKQAVDFTEPAFRPHRRNRQNRRNLRTRCQHGSEDPSVPSLLPGTLAPASSAK
jgi:hypothetical protein